jgi:hypothetical protein
MFRLGVPVVEFSAVSEAMKSPLQFATASCSPRRCIETISRHGDRTTNRVKLDQHRRKVTETLNYDR